MSGKKRVVCLLVAAVTVAAALASCAPSRTAVAANVRLTSSDALGAAEWLTDRLGEVPDRVVLGTDAAAYGLDLSSLEDDGYIIRSLGGEVAVFARTPDGLDRAVRKYAKAVESGIGVADETYHEGYRVDRLTVAGSDISEYAIVRVSEDDPCVTSAASILAKYIEKACGAALPVCTEADFAAVGRARRIEISSGDEALGDEGFEISLGKDGTLAIRGGVWRGSLYGACGLLEDIGWRFIAVPGSYYDELVPSDRQEYLYEAEHVDLTDAISRTEIPSIPIRGGCLGLMQKNTYSTLLNAAYGGLGFTIRACHGLQNNHAIIFSGEYEGVYPGFAEAGYKQPCFTNEEVLEAIDHYALESVRKRIGAGQKIGREIIDVDVAHWDGGSWTFCRCKSCDRMYALEGCHTGAVLRMANRVAALLNENYEGVCASILAYGPTAPLPKITRPADNLIVAFCFFGCDGYCAGSCQNHCVSGADCDVSRGGFTNYHNAVFFEEWAEILDPKKIQIWYYPSDGYDGKARFYGSPMYTTILEDMKYIASFGVEHVYYCMERNARRNNGNVCEGLAEYIGARCMWNSDMTEKEEHELIREWFRIICGDEAGDELFELAMFAERAGDLAGCWCSYEDHDRVNYGFVAKHADSIWEKCRRACALADDAAGEYFAEKNTAGYMYMVIRGCYDDTYAGGTDAERALIAARCRETWERMCGIYGFDAEAFDPAVDPKDWEC